MLTCQDNDPNVWVIPCISEAPRHLHDYKHHKRDQLRSSDIELNILEDMLQFALCHACGCRYPLLWLIGCSPVLGVNALRVSGLLMVICSQSPATG